MSEIRVLKTIHEGWHQDAVNELEECLADVKGNPDVNTVIVCMEDRVGHLSIRWSGCEDRARLGSRLMLAGLRRMGLQTG